MRVRTEPSLPEIEQDLSIEPLTPEVWFKGIQDIVDAGYAPVSVLIRRAVRPGFQMRISLKLVADWDPQLDGADMVILLRRRISE